MQAPMADGNQYVDSAAIPPCGIPERCALRDRLLAEAERHLAIPINPVAALLRTIRSESGFAPNSAEFNFSFGDRSRTVQRAEHIGAGSVRYYHAYPESGRWITSYFDRASSPG